MMQRLRKEKINTDSLKHDDLKDSSKFLKVHLYVLPTLAYTKKGTSQMMIQEYMSVTFISVSAWECGCMCVQVEAFSLTHILFRICPRVNSYPELYYHFMLSFCYLIPIFNRTLQRRRVKNYLFFVHCLAVLLPL